MKARASFSRAASAQARRSSQCRAHAGLPDDLINFHYVPVTCAVSLGWEDVEVEEHRLRAIVRDDLLRLAPDPHGRYARLVVQVDGDAFAETWLRCVERIGSGSG